MSRNYSSINKSTGTLKKDSVLTLGEVEDGIVIDRSSKKTVGEIYSARAVELDGVADYVDLGDLGTLPVPVTRVEAQVRRTVAGNLPVQLNTLGGTVNLPNARVGAWEDVAVDTPAREFGEYMWFDGVDDRVTNFFSLNHATPWELEFDIWRTDTPNIYMFISSDGPFNGSVYMVFNGTISFFLGGTTAGVNAALWGAVVNPLGHNSLRFTWDGVGTAELFVFGESQGTRFVSDPVTTAATFSTNLGWSGFLRNIRANGTLIATGKGTTSADWGGGTVLGSPQTVSQFYSNANQVRFGQAWAGQLANVRLLGPDDQVIARYLLNEHRDELGDGLNGLPCLDSSGNGNHGEYVGCSGVAGIGVPVEMRGLREQGDYMWFDGAVGVTNIPGGITIPDGGSLSFDILHRSYTWLIKGIGSTAHLLPGSFTAPWGYRVLVAGVSYNYPPGIWKTSGDYAYGHVEMARSGSNYSLYIDGDFKGSLTIPESPTFTMINGNGAGNYHLIGTLRNLRINGTLIATGKGTTSADWGGGTVSGNPNTIGELRKTPPQVAGGSGWNAYSGVLTWYRLNNNTSDSFRRRLHGTLLPGTTYTDTPFGPAIRVAAPGQGLELPSDICATFNGKSEFSISMQVRDFTISGGYFFNLFFNTVSGLSLYYTPSNRRVRWIGFGNITTTASATFPSNTWVTVVATLNLVTKERRVFITGVSTLSHTIGADAATTFGLSGKTYIGCRDESVGYLDSEIRNIIIYNRALTVTEGRFVADTQAELPVTMAGAIEVYPATTSNPSLDALGNPIAIPRPNPSALLHPPGSSTFVPNPGPVRSVTLWVYNDGQTETLVTLGDPAVGLAANQVATTNITAPQVYVDDTLTSTVPPGWHMVTVQSTTPFGTTDWELQSQIGNLISYNQEPLSIAKITRNFNALKRKYQI